MDHFYINQVCTNCWKGNQMFKVDLSLYDQNGKLRIGINEIEQFCFICVYCWKTTRLDIFSSEHDITSEANRKTTQTTSRCIKETEFCIS